MASVQEDYERTNAVDVKLSESRQEMEMFFDLASQDANDTRLFIAMLQKNLEKILPQVFESEMVAVVLSKVRMKNWQDRKVFLSYMDLELLHLVEEKRINLILEKIKDSQAFYEQVMRKLIEKECPERCAEWKNYADRMKEIVASAASKSAKSTFGRACVFTEELQRGICNNFQNVLPLNFLVDGDEYGECDNAEPRVLEQLLIDHCFNVMDQYSFTLRKKEWISRLIDQVLGCLRENRSEGALPRCTASCPMCKSLCILPFGHIVTKKHETFHQPKGLAGWRWAEKHRESQKAGTLVTGTCSSDSGRFWYNGRYNDPKEFGQLFPDWTVPTQMETLIIREYIMANFNKEIAAIYHAKPSVDIPENYYHNLNDIRADLATKTGEVVLRES